ncbi:aminotransferase class III-fold pyridoxal phosphate-dependent enzyme [Cobetia marina]
MFDDQGKRYLDVYNNVPSIGHCHPRVVQAVAEQMGTLNVHNRYLHEGIHRYAERLLDTLPHALNRLVMMCTGSEKQRYGAEAGAWLDGPAGDHRHRGGLSRAIRPP